MSLERFFKPKTKNTLTYILMQGKSGIRFEDYLLNKISLIMERIIQNI
jgi:hypothetical protein